MNVTCVLVVCFLNSTVIFTLHESHQSLELHEANVRRRSIIQPEAFPFDLNQLPAVEDDVVTTSEPVLSPKHISQDIRTHREEPGQIVHHQPPSTMSEYMFDQGMNNTPHPPVSCDLDNHKTQSAPDPKNNYEKGTSTFNINIVDSKYKSHATYNQPEFRNICKGSLCDINSQKRSGKVTATIMGENKRKQTEIPSTRKMVEGCVSDISSSEDTFQKNALEHRKDLLPMVFQKGNDLLDPIHIPSSEAKRLKTNSDHIVHVIREEPSNINEDHISTFIESNTIQPSKTTNALQIKSISPSQSPTKRTIASERSDRWRDQQREIIEGFQLKEFDFVEENSRYQSSMKIVPASNDILSTLSSSNWMSKKEHIAHRNSGTKRDVITFEKIWERRNSVLCEAVSYPLHLKHLENKTQWMPHQRYIGNVIIDREKNRKTELPCENYILSSAVDTTIEQAYMLSLIHLALDWLGTKSNDESINLKNIKKYLNVNDKQS